MLGSLAPTRGNGSALATAALARDRFPEIARDWGLDP
jgi:hypothetical protein